MAEDNLRMEKELKTVALMIDIFCHGQHGKTKGLCTECQELFDYVTQRLEKCPFLDNKPRCSKCTVHCYKPDMKEKIRAVMKYAGPRMLCYHPILSGRHYAKL